MATIIPNLVTPFIKGLLGSIVFKRRNGKAYVAMKPVPSSNPLSAGQLATRARFKLASVYANGVADDPLQAAYYQPIAVEKGTSLFSAAMVDYLKAPTVETIDLSAYSGGIGHKLTVVAVDDAAVASVHVAIRNAADAIIEQGEAVSAAGAWSYTATTNLTSGQSVTIIATAKDRPGNTAVKTVPYQKP